MRADRSQGDCQLHPSHRIQTQSHLGQGQRKTDVCAGDGKCLKNARQKKEIEKLQIVVCGIISRQNKLLKIIENDEEVESTLSGNCRRCCKVPSLAILASLACLPSLASISLWWRDSDAFCLANAFFCYESLIRELTKMQLLSASPISLACQHMRQPYIYPLLSTLP